MNNKTIYNPLFESLKETARRYDRINEDSAEYRLKGAIEYANKILQLTFDQYVYFVTSVPLASLKQDLVKKSLTFVDGLGTKTDLTLQSVIDLITKEWESASGSIMANQDLMKLSPAVKDIYTKVSEGMSALKETVDLYIKRYGTEMNNPQVTTAIKTFVGNSAKILKEKNNL